MFNPAIYANSQGDGIGVLEVVEPTTKVVIDPLPAFVPLQRTELHGEVVGPLADLRLLQTFCYARTVCDQTLEARYRFPLPGDAAITGVTVRFGEVEIVATLQERQQAEEAYAEAKAQGRQATLTTRESPDVFTLQVAGLQPDQPVTVETHYVQLARLESQGNRSAWRLRVPLTTAPRYTRSDEAGSRHASGQPLALLRDPGHRFALELCFQGVVTLQSPTHRLQTTSVAATDGGQLQTRVQLAEGEVLPDRDCVLAWSLPQAERQPTLACATYWDQAAQQCYFLALVAPPALRPGKQAHPREVILLVDHSGSMSGPKWEAADWAVERFLGDLQPADHFALAIFHNRTRWFQQKVLPARQSTITEATAWFKAQRDSGGTELGVALEQGLQLPRTARGDRSLARHLLIITDAAVSDAARILRLADQEAAAADRRRISVLCIDAAPNDFLVQALAERGGGLARFLTSDPQQEDIATALDEVLLAWGEPLLVNLQLTVNQPTVTVSGRGVTHTDGDGRSLIDLGDLPAGQTQWVVGRVPWTAADQAHDLLFDLWAGHDAQLASQRVRADQAGATPALKALFGAQRVNGLEHLINANYPLAQVADQLQRMGYDPAFLGDLSTSLEAPVYAENARQALHAKLRQLLVDEALCYGLASAETAFVATRAEAGERVDATVAVANALPAGWAEGFALYAPRFASSVAPAAMPMTALAQPTASPGIAHSPVSRSPVARSIGAAARAVFGGNAKADATAAPTERSMVIFSGELPLADRQTLLFDSSTTSERLPDALILSALRVESSDKANDKISAVVAQLTLAIYVDDLATPRARVRLRDLLRYGERPLNLQRMAGQLIQVVLEGAALSEPQAQPTLALRLTLRYQPR